jgi:hypothetical protein
MVSGDGEVKAGEAYRSLSSLFPRFYKWEEQLKLLVLTQVNGQTGNA